MCNYLEETVIEMEMTQLVYAQGKQLLAYRPSW